MRANNAHLQAVLLFARRPAIPPTAREKRLQIAFFLVCVLLVLGFIVTLFIGLFTFNDLLTRLALLLLYADVALAIAWVAAIIISRRRRILSAVQAQEAAGIPIPPPTIAETSGCITYATGIALTVILGVGIPLFVPPPENGWLLALWLPLAWFPAILCGVLWRRLRRPQREDARQA
jgi:hypothetical protein